MKSILRTSLVNGIVFIVLGIILFLYPDEVVAFVSYALGALLLIVGLYKCINYYIHDKKNGIVNRNEMAFGVTAIVLGLIFIFLGDALSLLLRFIVGIWLIISGVNNIIQTFYTTRRDSKYYSLFVVGFILIAIGLYIVCVSNLAISIIGLFMMLYGIIEVVSYFAYKNAFDDTKTVWKRKIKNEPVEAEVVDEKIEEDK